MQQQFMRIISWKAHNFHFHEKSLLCIKFSFPVVLIPETCACYASPLHCLKRKGNPSVGFLPESDQPNKTGSIIFKREAVHSSTGQQLLGIFNHQRVSIQVEFNCD